MIRFFWLLVLSLNAFAGPEEAQRLRQKIQQKMRPKAQVAEEFKLPVSRGFAQKDSQLCWVYAFLNAQETLHLVQHPQDVFELSRGALQVRTMEDRIMRKLTGVEDYLSERGTPVDAFVLAQRVGLVAYNDFPDIILGAQAQYNKIARAAARGQDLSHQAEILQNELIRLFGSLPEKTLGEDVLAGQEWMAYAPSEVEGVRTHPDSDARLGSLATFVQMETFKKLVHDHLKNGQPVTYSANGHVILLYGAQYDASGNALTFFMKDSYAPFFYEAKPRIVFQEVLEMSMLKN